MEINERIQKLKCARRIVNYSEIYKYNFDELMHLELQELKKLQLNLFIALRIKYAYKKRHSN